ncbi:MAG: putative rane protein [Firmicutes bacterium]|nr:putative rane protein [Bacillota bacterium]
MKKKIWIIMIGILLLALDFKVPVGRLYPSMIKDLTIGEELQLRIVNNFIGTRPLFDVIPDLLGFALIFIGCALLVRKNIRFFVAMLLIPIAMYYYIRLPLLPYQLESRDLYLTVAGNQIILITIEILIEFFVIHGIVTMTNCLQNNWNNNELLGGWIIAMMSKGLLVGIDFFFGEHIFYVIYYLIFLGATVFYLNRLLKTLEFNPGEIIKTA